MGRITSIRTLAPFAARLTSRSARVRARIGAAATRSIAAFAAAGILLAGQSSIHVGGAASRDALRSVSPATSLVALHANPAQRLSFASRSSAHWPAGSDVPLPEDALRAPLWLGPQPIAIAAGSVRIAAPVLARGYDATAPPALR